jgi:amino acid transporter
MGNMGIPILPHIVNALVMTSILSAGNSYTYCATRSLYGLAIAGRAPRFLRYCTKQGVPIYCLAVVMLFPLLSFLQLSNSSAKVLGLLVNLITGGIMITFIIINLTFLNYYQACKVQGIDRKTRPYCGYWQPYGAYVALTIQLAIAIFSGYTAFSPFKFSSFFINYTMQLIAGPLYLLWKFFKKTRYVRPENVDLVWERPLVDAYESSLLEPPETFWGEMLCLFRIRRSS